MRKIICDFCKMNPPVEQVLPLNTTTPKGWAEWRVTTGHGGNVSGISKTMCPSCAEERNVTIKPYAAASIGDTILEELYDGIRDIVSDAIGDM